MPVLLRHQQALQLVGQPRHHALHRRQLLVEKRAQPRQLLGSHKVGGGDFLVELGGEDLVAPFVGMGEGGLIALRPGAIFRFGGVRQVFGLLRLHVAFDLIAILRIGGGFGGGAFALVLGILIVAIVILPVGIFALGILVGGLAVIGVAERQVIEHRAGQGGRTPAWSRSTPASRSRSAPAFS